MINPTTLAAYKTVHRIAAADEKGDFSSLRSFEVTDDTGECSGRFGRNLGDFSSLCSFEVT
ncbi:MAG: hypothetical protein OCD76_16420 [Reichenbachiella sp.]